MAAPRQSSLYMHLPPAEPVAHSPASAEMHRAFDAQRAAFGRGAPDYRHRMDALEALRAEITASRQALLDALSADFGNRAPEETLLIELFQLSEMIAQARSCLKRWMKPKRVRPNWFLLPATTRVVYQPLGVVGIISPWNFPVLLSFSPMVDALAAGNHVMLKPSELTPRTCELIVRMIERRFPPEYVTAITGGPDVGREFAALPFDHLLFTGSSRVGALVMQEAAANLTPVTLELSGKSPVIVHESFPLEVAARRIMAGKLLNAGQSCLAPDYLLLPRGRENAFELAARRAVAELYPTLVSNTDYTRMLRGYERLTAAIAEATAQGARVARINPANEECSLANGVFPPTLVFGARADATLLTEEIFGPVLPVVPYDSLDDAIAWVNAHPRPLAVYYFDDDGARQREVITRTHSGAVNLNDVVIQFAQFNLPFGGVGLSGMGQYHGFDGFQAFSKKKGVMVQRRFSTVALLNAPYAGRPRALLEWLLRISRR